MVSVTIAMPVYNGADYLDQALASLSAQTFRDLVIIVSDNASTDATPEIIAKWQAKDPRIVAHRQATNIGAAANAEWLFSRIESQWMMHASHDDWWSPNFVEELYNTAMKYPGTRLAVPQLVIVRPDGSEDARRCDEKANELAGLGKIRRLLKISHSEWYYGLFDRQALQAAKGPMQAYGHIWGFSGILLLPFILKGAVAGCNAAVYYKRETPLSMIRYKPKTWREQAGLYKDFFSMSVKVLWAQPFSAKDKIMLLALMPAYANKCAWKLKKLIRGLLLGWMSRGTERKV